MQDPEKTEKILARFPSECSQKPQLFENLVNHMLEKVEPADLVYQGWGFKSFDLTFDTDFDASEKILVNMAKVSVKNFATSLVIVQKLGCPSYIFCRYSGDSKFDPISEKK